VYWVDGPAVKKVPIGGGTPVVLAAGQNEAFGLVVDAAHLYWSSYGAGTVTRANLDGSAATVVATGQRQPYSMAADDLAVYWINDEFRMDCASPPCGGVMKLAK
jgi:sugar lactone lactonase YvrE